MTTPANLEAHSPRLLAGRRNGANAGRRDRDPVDDGRTRREAGSPFFLSSSGPTRNGVLYRDDGPPRAARQNPLTCSMYPPRVIPRTLTAAHPNSVMSLARRR